MSSSRSPTHSARRHVMYITACATFMHHVLLYICVCLFVDGMTPSVLRRSSGICSTTKSTTSTSVKFPISYQARTAAICVLHTHSHRLVHLACICCHRCVCACIYAGGMHSPTTGYGAGASSPQEGRRSLCGRMVSM